MSVSPLPPWLNRSPWQRAEAAGGEGRCLGLCGWGAWLQSYGRGLALHALRLFPLEVVGDGAADHAAPVLTALPSLAAAAFLGRYGREAVPGLTRIARIGLYRAKEQHRSLWRSQREEKRPLLCTFGGGLTDVSA